MRDRLCVSEHHTTRSSCIILRVTRAFILRVTRAFILRVTRAFILRVTRAFVLRVARASSYVQRIYHASLL